VGASLPVLAETFPTRPISWIVPYPAGGGADFISRLVAQQMTRTLGQPLVIENRSGASGAIGAAAAARAPADGYTVVTGDNGILTINPHFYNKLAYDPVGDFKPVGLMAKVPFLLVVNPSVISANSVSELINYAKVNPGKV